MPPTLKALVAPRRRLRVLAWLVAATAFVGCAPAISGLSIPTDGPGSFSDRIPASLSKPDGPGPFPAVVIMHDCSGLGPRSSGAPDRWARELLRQGYVVLILDSFTTRGHPDGVCINPLPSRNDVSPSRRVYDAYAALAYLRTCRTSIGCAWA
jgi:dienelactone hydrolase